MFTNYIKKEAWDKVKKTSAFGFIIKFETTLKMVAQRIKELVAEDKKLKKV